MLGVDGIGKIRWAHFRDDRFMNGTSGLAAPSIGASHFLWFELVSRFVRVCVGGLQSESGRFRKTCERRLPRIRTLAAKDITTFETLDSEFRHLKRWRFWRV